MPPSPGCPPPAGREPEAASQACRAGAARGVGAQQGVQVQHLVGLGTIYMEIIRHADEIGPRRPRLGERISCGPDVWC
jgi:hypothetical protein